MPGSKSTRRSESTIDDYRTLIDRTIVPALGDIPASKLGTRSLEQFYAQLRRCRVRCKGRQFIEHRTDGPHECRTVRHRRRPGRPSAKSIAEHNCTTAGCTVIECLPHVCKPLAAATVRKVHFILSAALSTATRWEWISSNPADEAKKPKQTPPHPKPPTAQQAARILSTAWEADPAWGLMVWLFMVTGARRGEVIALRFTDAHLDQAVLEVRRSYTHRSGKRREADTKTHQMRRISLDAYTVELIREHLRRCRELSVELGFTLDENSFMFSYKVDHSSPCNPDAISHRYTDMCAGLGIESHLHTLRHYSATELIRAGVDIRTVAGRLGHGGGGTTTLRVYAAWVEESDRDAADIIAGRTHKHRPELTEI